MDRRSNKIQGTPRRSDPLWALIAVLAYAALAIPLFGPSLGQGQTGRLAWPASLVVGGMGVYVLGRRWVVSGPASLVSGAIYGFGPLSLYVTRFNPLAGLLVAGIPWMFCPAVFFRAWVRTQRGRSKTLVAGQWLQWPLLILPFGAIAVAMGVLGRCHLFPIPLYGGSQGADGWIGWVAPGPTAQHGKMPAGLYHVPWVGLATGAVMLIKARRWPILGVTGAAAVLAFLPPILGTNPVIWLLVVTVWLAVVAGLGLEGLVLAGWADRTWLWIGLAVLTTLCLATLVWAARQEPVAAWSGDVPLIHSLTMYGVGMAAVALMLAAAQLKIRVSALRQAVLYGAAGLDIVLSARLLADLLL
jgi:hypothetical protein